MDARTLKSASLRDPRSKGRHIKACLTERVLYRRTTGLERFDFVSQALPDIALSQIDLSATLAGHTLSAPLMIAPMTGGDRRALVINHRLARAAQRWGLAMGVGSQRVAIEDGSRARYFELRSQAPTALLFANLGAAQLVKGWGRDEALRAVEMIRADALFIHLNPIQEAIQGGDLDFRGVGERLTRLCEALKAAGVPVFAREVGFGISEPAARQLLACGVSGIDCAGAGGTSWARVESLCADSEREHLMGERFGEWGIPTSDSILNVRRVSRSLPLIACGGLTNGIELAKALALGADVGGMARSMLVKACQGEDALNRFIADTLDELRICMFGTGAATVAALRGTVVPCR
ncbi:type 2 isopentenyl-diphosphate Delta-isomerase [Ectothiorhodospira lacustris]|uniref:type 2 isopentenyl-diphosphate Delta-isomerase n=1 Tax=Ectothiorhodospira lacustris TaxID=2899127 RepID=UPI001EE97193|nr:type 2 isopentenyl-diphosphate Delta-isomerase [Ectothiorhodospira lacustris]MCG5501274.1 type 2 isopentenyl-diphosphate Delta-isomerase [Ectothiorhodospira lacustris]MCG5509298.1 type 2 isopentenyl-diphosphate Delta-isomerase [Ectothiorhodospira lacustris]MCG5521352.1 type 2 isopentenyl-diphosphate Delta-isomerase [Ectothiorhodospira lacustris]